MRWARVMPICALILLAGCASDRLDGERIASLESRSIDTSDRVPADSVERAMDSYRAFLANAPESEMTPEALRRLADLKIQRGANGAPAEGRAGTQLDSPILARSGSESDDASQDENANRSVPQRKIAEGTSLSGTAQGEDPQLEAIEERSQTPAAQDGLDDELGSEAPTTEAEAQMLREEAASAEAIRLYRQLLRKYPNYERRDQVLYQLARAHGIRGEQDEAMETLNRLVERYPHSQHFVEAQFRRGEILFVRESYRAAERAYRHVTDHGPGSSFYDQAIYKHGWSRFKQEQYRDGIDSFVRLLDKTVPGGRGMLESMNQSEQKRIEDTLRVMSFSFTYMGGPEVLAEYFADEGSRAYIDLVYGDLGDYFVDKERYSDAAETFSLFVERNPLHERAVDFQRRVIGVYEKGGFPASVLEAKKNFAQRYAPDAQYWQVHDLAQRPDTRAFIQSNLVDLAKHYHALSQELDPNDEAEEQQAAVGEAISWYREFITSFPEAEQAPELNFLLGDLLYDNGRFREAAEEYTATAYDYDAHSRAAEAGLAAVSAYEQLLAEASEARKGPVERRLIDSSLHFADAFRDHPESADVLGSAGRRLFDRENYPVARDTGLKLVERYPEAEEELRRSAWVIVAHSRFELEQFSQAERGYDEALALTPEAGETAELYGDLTERLAASIYKQGEAARAAGNLGAAVEHFLRIDSSGHAAGIRQTAEFDAAAALIEMESWARAARVLEDYRANYPESERQAEVTKKLAVVYEEDDRLGEAADEFVRIERGVDDPELKREANIRAAELYEEVGMTQEAIDVYERYVQNFPEPVEYSLETRNRLAELYGDAGQPERRREELRQIVAADADAGDQRTPRTKYLAAKASLELAEPLFEEFKAAKLTLPLQESLARKKEKMERAVAEYESMLDYGVAEVTAAATYHLGAIYYDLTRALLESDRPEGLSDMERQQYDILLEERAYPFEEKAINIHEKNIDLMTRGVFNRWVERSIDQLGQILPARYAKSEVSENYVEAIR